MSVVALLISALIAWTGSVCAAPDARIALVIGNAEYKSAPLRNPVNDARAIARALKEAGFEVDLKENISQQGFIAALRSFAARLKDTGGTGLFYYAGHGMQVKGANYLIPVDAGIESEDEIRYMAVDANQVLDKMEQAGNRLNIVILDACRDNPFSRSFRSKQSGLAQMDAPSGMLIAFATSPGAVAYDGEGANGVYTKHLLRNLSLPGLPVELVLKRVREGVSKDTDNRQIPWESSSLLGDFYFVGNATSAGPAATADAVAIELAFWNAVKDSGVAGEYRTYLEAYPEGRFAPLARERMNNLPATARPAGPSAETAVALAQPLGVAASGRALRSIGDTWTYDVLRDGKRKIDTVTMTVTRVDGGMIEEELKMSGFSDFHATRTFNAGFDASQRVQEVKLPLGIVLVEFSPYVSMREFPPAQQDWGTRSATLAMGHNSVRSMTTVSIKSFGEETVRVPAGEFRAIRVEAQSGSVTSATHGQSRVIVTYWYAPQLGRTVRITRRFESMASIINTLDSFELSRYSVAGAH
jgi:hypothetical protein